MYMGIDLGTSSVKVAIIDEAGRLLDSASSPLSSQQLHPLWSEQDPESWWQGTKSAVGALAQRQSLQSLRGISFSGHMHGATLLDKKGAVLRPCILWNDGRAFQQCSNMESKFPEFQNLTGNLVMPGFTAPKLVWVAENEPEIFAKIDKVLLPKDYLRYRLTGEFYSDMSDASGTLWLDIAQRDWSEKLLAATGLSMSQMPKVVEGNADTGKLRTTVAQDLNLPAVPVFAGAGDNAAGAIVSGTVASGQAMLSLGTSGIYFLATDAFCAQPKSAVHSFCHALPERWHLMSVMLSAAACVEWAANMCIETDIGNVFSRVEQEMHPHRMQHAPIFLPYLSGERTPHNNAKAKGVMFGLSGNHATEDIFYAVLEGVSYGLCQGIEVVHETGVQPSQLINLIGGGARSNYWRQLLANICDKTMAYCEGGEVGPALGAARLAQLGVNGFERLDDICPVPKVIQIHEPYAGNAEVYTTRFQKFKKLYKAVEDFY